mmetsp:Transcript_105187/g.274598  ORF Transcript_105187/g.274598 Transcript_105187/m.274598 type:complete len:225 (-) Transcript_105187:1247-1921(-)
MVREACRSPLVGGAFPAARPVVDTLERVVGRRCAIAAVCPSAPGVPDELLIENGGDADMVQAQRHEHVLAPLLPPERVPALRAAVEKLADGGVGERLEGAEEARLAVPVAVLEVHALSAAVQGELPPQPAGHQHGVRVGLHDPVVVGPSAVALDHLPGVHEELRVRGRARVGHADRGVGEDQRRHVVAQVDVHGAQHSEVVAVEDAGAEGLLPLEQAHLLGVEA